MLAGEQARLETTGHLYNSLVHKAEATRLAARDRSRVWSLLGEARRLETPEVDVDELRHEAIRSMGDFVGLALQGARKGFRRSSAPVAIDRRSRYLAVGLESGGLQFFDPVSGRRLAAEKVTIRPSTSSSSCPTIQHPVGRSWWSGQIVAPEAEQPLGSR